MPITSATQSIEAVGSLTQVTGRSLSGFTLALALSCTLLACGGGDTSSNVSDSTLSRDSSLPLPGSNQTNKVLMKPVLSFSDTGLSVTDGITSIGTWQVSTLEGWEYSFDMGKNWIRGQGDYFDVQGDGAKTIWVRARDDMGNTSEIVVVSCVLDTLPPETVRLEVVSKDLTRLVRIAGLEQEATWQYSFDDQRSWLQGKGQMLAVMGNLLPTLWVRQVDLAGNHSLVERVNLIDQESLAWHEASGMASQPSQLSTQGIRTALLHGSVVRGDLDYIKWDIPLGHRLESIRLIHYASADPIAFYALQKSTVFDAGQDVTRMLKYGHIGPQDLQRNLIQDVQSGQLTAGPMTLWFQQTGTSTTEYVIELVFQPVE